MLVDRKLKKYATIDTKMAYMTTSPFRIKADRFSSGSKFTLTGNTVSCHVKVAYTSGPIFEKIMKRYPIFSVQIINYQNDQKYK